MFKEIGNKIKRVLSSPEVKAYLTGNEFVTGKCSQKGCEVGYSEGNPPEKCPVCGHPFKPVKKAP